jgi:hypothetical protein
MTLTWSNPSLLPVLGAAVIPLLVHLLARRWHRRVAFSAMMFLPTGASHRERLGRLRQALLLLTRSMLLALLVLALAGPSVGVPGTPDADRVSLLIVLDCSPSMGVNVAGRSRLDDARQHAADTLARLRPGDRAAVFFAGSSQPPLPLTDNLSAVVQAISSASLGNTRCDLRAVLQQVMRSFDDDNAASHLLVITDAQSANFENVDDALLTQFASAPARSRLRTTLCRVGAPDAGNLAITGMQFVSPPAVRDVPAEIEIELRHFGGRDPATAPLRVSVANKPLFETTVVVEPNATRVVRRAVRLPSSGPTLLTASIETSGLKWDDRIELAGIVSEPVNVLVLSNEPSAKEVPPDSSAGFVRAALAPYRTGGQRGGDIAAVEIAPPSRFPAVVRDTTRVIVLVGAAGLNDAQVRALEQFVYEGGGLMFIPDPAESPAVLADRLWRDGRSLLPARPVGWRRFDEPAGVVRSNDLPALPAIRAPSDPVPSARFQQVIELDDPDEPENVLLLLDNGLPLLTARRFGEGRVLAWSTPLDGESSSLPLTDGFLPLLHALTRHLVAPSAPELEAAPGAPVVLRLRGTRETIASIQRPDGKDDRVELVQLGDERELRYNRADQPGKYVVRVRGMPEQAFVLPRDPLESDLSDVSPTDPRLARLFDEVIDVSDGPAIVLANAGPPPRSLVVPLLLAVVLLLAADVALGGGVGSRGGRSR